jgi:hypothetical protein
MFEQLAHSMRLGAPSMSDLNSGYIFGNGNLGINFRQHRDIGYQISR